MVGASLQLFGQELAWRWVEGTAWCAGLSFWAAAAARPLSLGGELLFGGDRRVFRLETAGFVTRGEGFFIERRVAMKKQVVYVGRKELCLGVWRF